MNRLRELRGKTTQEKLAKLLGLTQRAYSNYEIGKREPDQDTLRKIADYFDVSIDYLLGRNDNPQPLVIPDEYKDLPIAFYDGAKGLTQKDIDEVVQYMNYLKSKKN